MKYFVWMITMVVFVFGACKKINSTTTSVMFYNGTWSLPAISAAWNGTDIIASPLAQGQSSVNADSAYLQVSAGTNLITIKTPSSTLLNKNIYSMAAAGSSFIIFDTVASAAPVRFLQLTDDLTIPDTGRIRYRVLDLVPDTTVKVDIWLVNGVTDSVRIDSALTFIGSSAEASAVQGFFALPYYASSYTVKIKKTLTEQLYASVTAYPFAVRGIYSIIFSGLVTGSGASSPKLSVLHHHIP